MRCACSMHLVPGGRRDEPSSQRDGGDDDAGGGNGGGDSKVRDELNPIVAPTAMSIVRVSLGRRLGGSDPQNSQVSNALE